jgi:hypothetical protein
MAPRALCEDLNLNQALHASYDSLILVFGLIKKKRGL